MSRYIKHDSLKRDLHPSIMQRTFPSHFYCFDADSDQYNQHAEMVGRIEYKHSHEMTIDLQDFQMRCHRSTCDNLKVPFFIVQYWFFGKNDMVIQTEDKQPILEACYFVIPGNKFAKRYINSPQELSLRGFVQLLGAIRGEDIAAINYSDILYGVSAPNIRNQI